jgi:hypothetical protein
MGHENLTTGGYFDPDRSRVLLQWGGWINPNPYAVYDEQTPGAFLYTRDMKMYATQSGSLIRRWPGAVRWNMISPLASQPAIVLRWDYAELGPQEASERLTRHLRWKDAQAWFPAHFSPDLACEVLIKFGKDKDAKKNFPDRYPWVKEKMRGLER